MKLFVTARVLLCVTPDLTTEELAYNLALELAHAYDNTADPITSEELIDIAKNALASEWLPQPSCKTFTLNVSDEECIGTREKLARARKILTDERIGEVYDPTLSPHANFKAMKAMGMKVCARSVYRFARENISPFAGSEHDRGNHEVTEAQGRGTVTEEKFPPLCSSNNIFNALYIILDEQKFPPEVSPLPWYDPSKTPHANYIWAKQNGIKVAKKTVYAYGEKVGGKKQRKTHPSDMDDGETLRNVTFASRSNAVARQILNMQRRR